MPLFRSFRSQTKKTVARHEQLVFYPSYASRNPDGKGWSLVVQGSVFDPRISWIRRKPMFAVIRRILRMDRTAEEFFRVRMRQFLMFGLRGRSITVKLGNQSHPVGESDYMGLFRGEIPASNEEISSLAVGGGKGDLWVSCEAVLPDSDDRKMSARVQLIEPSGVSIISDVDDTIKHSNVPNRRDLFRNTFTRTFVPIIGMPELYQQCASAGAAFHFVSGSPWQLYEPLAEFMREMGYPAGSFHLKRFRIRDSARKIRPSPQKTYKRASIEPILAAFPNRKFILVGDSGEQDPEIYASLLRERPNQIIAVFIRAVRDKDGDAVRLQQAFSGLDSSRWILYSEPQEIQERLLTLVGRE